MINGFPAKVLMADAAYHADRLRQVIADQDAVAVQRRTSTTLQFGATAVGQNAR